MRLETKHRKARPLWLKKASLISLLLAAITVPIYVWYVHGRKLPLRITLNASQYVVFRGEAIALFVDVIPAHGGAVEIRFSDPRVTMQSKLTGRWLAKEPGTFAIAVEASRSGTRAKDAVTVRVLDRPLKDYPRRVGARSPTRPPKRPICPTPASPPSVTIIGEACRGANLVLMAQGAVGDEIWHRLGDDPRTYRRGRLANLRLPRDATGELLLHSLIGDPNASCFFALKTKVNVANCDASPAPGRVFADFAWQLVGRQHFRFTAKPARGEGEAFGSYRWTFGDGQSKTTTVPKVAHRYQKVAAFRVVGLEVTRGEARAKTQRAIFDRTALSPLAP